MDTKINEPGPPLWSLHGHNHRRGAPRLRGRAGGAGEAGAGKDSCYSSWGQALKGMAPKTSTRTLAPHAAWAHHSKHGVSRRREPGEPRCLGAELGRGLLGGTVHGAACSRERSGRVGRLVTRVCKPSFWLGRRGMSKAGAEIIQGPVRELPSWSLRLGLREGGQALPQVQLEGTDKESPG